MREPIEKEYNKEIHVLEEQRSTRTPKKRRGARVVDDVWKNDAKMDGGAGNDGTSLVASWYSPREQRDRPHKSSRVESSRGRFTSPQTPSRWVEHVGTPGRTRSSSRL